MAVKAISDPITLVRVNDGADGAAGQNAIDLSNGKMLFTDPYFANGKNQTYVYNNSNNGNVTVTRSSRSSDNPFTNSDYELVIKNVGTSSPNCGGFYFGDNYSRANAIFIYRIIAKIPSGRKIIFGHNAWGNSPVFKWLTSNVGTGKFEEYLGYAKCGDAGTFSTIGFFYIDGAVGSSSSPMIWYVAYATCFDMTNVADIFNIGGRNLYALSQNHGISKSNISSLTLDASTGIISMTASGSDAYFGIANANGATWAKNCGLKIPVISGKDITISYTNTIFNKNYYNRFNSSGTTISNNTYFSSTPYTISASKLTDVSFITLRFGYRESVAGTTYSTKIKVEYGNVATDWTPAPEDVQSGIDEAQSTADTALTTANGKGKVYYQASAPTSGMTTQDIWFDTDDGNSMYRYNGTAWVRVQLGTNAINDKAINAAKIVDKAITNAKFGDSSVDARVVAAQAIGTAEIHDAAVTNAKIDALAVDNAQIIDGAITEAKIDDLAVTSAKIADAAVGTAKIQDAAVGTAKIVDAAVATAKIKDLAVTNGKLANLAVDNAKIANGTIQTAKIKDGAITNAKIADATIQTAKIHDGAITNAKIHDASIESAKIKSVNADTINSGTINAIDINGSNITGSTITGSIIRSDWERWNFVGNKRVMGRVRLDDSGFIMDKWDSEEHNADPTADSDPDLYYKLYEGTDDTGYKLPNGGLCVAKYEKDADTGSYGVTETHFLPFLESVYPVGAIYISTVSTSPATLFGFGTWEAIEGKFLLASSDTYTAGSTGGEATHTLTGAEMPAHSHRVKGWAYKVTPVTTSSQTAPTWPITQHDNYSGRTDMAGSTQPHNNMPPYLAVYMWKRTA
ncbi:MAG: phage baseplate protein [Bilifractor sp.]|jgi:hypothetical protein